MNIVLIGMPACGKSTIGVLLAKAKGFSFIDTDLLVQATEKKLLSEIIAKKGNEEFLKIEEKILLSISCDLTVIATGGSAVYSDKGMAHLKKNSCVIYLMVDYKTIEKRISDIKTRGVVIPFGMNLAQVYSQRDALYNKHADIKIDTTNLCIEECVETIVTKYEKFLTDNMKG